MNRAGRTAHMQTAYGVEPDYPFEGDTVSGSLMAGQVAGMLHEVRPVAQILEELWDGGRQRITALDQEC